MAGATLMGDVLSPREEDASLDPQAPPLMRDARRREFFPVEKELVNEFSRESFECRRGPRGEAIDAAMPRSRFGDYPVVAEILHGKSISTLDRRGIARGWMAVAAKTSTEKFRQP